MSEFIELLNNLELDEKTLQELEALVDNNKK